MSSVSTLGFVFILFLTSLFASSEETSSPSVKITTRPWFIGSLRAPTGQVVPYGNTLVQSYLYVDTDKGFYDQNWHAVSREENFYSLSAQFLCFFGLTPWCDLNVVPRFDYQKTSNQQAFYPGDLVVGLDFQLMAIDFTPYFPGIKLAIREVFPTGSDQRLSPRKLMTDQTGEGTFGTQFDLVLYKIFQLSTLRWLSTTLSAQYTLHTPVHVHGFNAYGGGFGTDGKVLPGNRFQGVLGFELTLYQNWVFAFDAVYTHEDESLFFGLPGISFEGVFAEVGRPSSEQLSLAPAIEYNFNERFGVIAGCWFSVLGRNSSEFINGVVNVQSTY